MSKLCVYRCTVCYSRATIENLRHISPCTNPNGHLFRMVMIDSDSTPEEQHTLSRCRYCSEPLKVLVQLIAHHRSLSMWRSMKGQDVLEEVAKWVYNIRCHNDMELCGKSLMRKE